MLLPVPGVFNLKHSNTRTLRAAYADSRNGGVPCKIAVIGDSTTAGAGAGPAQTYSGAFPNTYTSKLAAALTNVGVKARNEGMFGDQYMSGQGGVTYPQYNTQVALGTGWAFTNFNGNTLGGYMAIGSNGAAGQLVITPAKAWDRAVITYAKLSTGASSVAVLVGGSANTTINAVASNQYVAQTITAGSLAVQSLAFGSITAGVSGFPVGSAYFYDSSDPGIVFMQFGMNGKTMQFAAENNPTQYAWCDSRALEVHQPHCTIINMTINDSNLGTSLDTYAAKLEFAVSKAELYGDVILCVGAPSGTASATDGTLDQYVAILRDCAIAHDIPLLSIRDLFESYAVSSALYSDTLHQKHTGHHVIASWLRNIVQSVL